MSRPERVLLLRSGRHLQVALDALAAAWPDCVVTVVGTAGSERAMAQAGVSADRVLLYTRRPRFTPLAFLTSTTALAARRRGFDRVAVLWNDPDGTGQGNVDRTAFALAPLGFLAVTPDGRLVPRSLWPQVGHELRRTVASAWAACVLAALYVPAALWPERRR